MERGIYHKDPTPSYKIFVLKWATSSIGTWATAVCSRLSTTSPTLPPRLGLITGFRSNPQVSSFSWPMTSTIPMKVLQLFVGLTWMLGLQCVIKYNLAKRISLTEWFFTRPGWRITSDTSTTTDPVPWQLRLSGILNYVNDTGEMVVEDFNGLYDIFVFSTREPSFDVFDVSSVCVDSEDYHILRMVVPGHERGVVDLGQFRRGIRRSITEYASIFPLQVGSIEVSDLLCAVIIQFAESTAACACHLMILVVCLHNLKGYAWLLQYNVLVLVLGGILTWCCCFAHFTYVLSQECCCMIKFWTRSQVSQFIVGGGGGELA